MTALSRKQLRDRRRYEQHRAEIRARQQAYYRKHRARHLARLADYRRQNGIHVQDESPAGWVIVAELGEREGIEFAQCRCARGHVAEIAIDVRPQPECVACLDGRT